MKKIIYLLGIALAMTGCKHQDNVAIVEEIPTSVHYPGNSGMPHIVLVSGDEEYRSEEALPMLARILSEHHGFGCTVLFAQNPEVPGLIDPNYGEHIADLDVLEDADGMILFTRFRALPNEQMRLFDNYFKDGKPVLGIRTATHAFHFPKEYPDSTWRRYTAFYDGSDEWAGGFGRKVLGETWRYHHGHHKHQSARGRIADQSDAHPILNGIEDGEIWGPTDVYGVRLPLPGDAHPILLGEVVERAGDFDEEDLMYGLRSTDTTVAVTNPQRPDISHINDPMMPVAWTKSYKLPGGAEGKAFTSTMGSSTDLLNAGLRRLIINATYWMTDLDIPPAANVDIIGPYEPTAYQFVEDSYWQEKQLKVSDYLLQ